MPEATFSTPLLALDAVVLDTETTGLDPRKARLLQIGAVRIQRGNLDADQRFVKLINPGALIPKASVAVHGITDAMVADAPKFPAVIQDFEAFVGNSFVIGHAITYDLSVLQREYSLAGRSWPRPALRLARDRDCRPPQRVRRCHRNCQGLPGFAAALA